MTFLVVWPWPDNRDIQTSRLDLGILKMYLHTEMKFLNQGFQTLEHEQYRQTHVTERIITLYSRVPGGYFATSNTRVCPVFIDRRVSVLTGCSFIACFIFSVGFVSRFRAPDIVCRRTYVLPQMLSFLFLLSSFFSPNLRARWTELNQNRPHARK